MIDLLFIQVIGGVFLLLYGVRLTGQGFELAFGARLKGLWSVPGGRLRAFAAFLKLAPPTLASRWRQRVGTERRAALTREWAVPM